MAENADGAALNLEGVGALVTGGASGLGAATVRALLARGARVAIVDQNEEAAQRLSSELGDSTRAFAADVTDEQTMGAAVDGAREAFGGMRVAVLCAGVGWAERVVSKQGPANLEVFAHVVRVNVVGSYNSLRLVAAAMNDNEPDEDGQRGVAIMTASVAAFDGQIGQTAYAASKGGVASLTLPAARDLAGRGIRVNTIAPGVFDTPMMGALPQDQRDALAANVPFPKRLGQPDEFALLACQLAEHPYLNGVVVRLDGSLRMPPR
ncbi:MAG: SDR family NAD(P)-dependent oxidoreductase [Thermoleophilaceae bacterium]|nr:SDR family NAD(P)-dependent oxidoreductase [Thermoleophilaceae bacterium]